MKIQLKSLNCNKLQNNSSNYNYLKFDPSQIPFELMEL